MKERVGILWALKNTSETIDWDGVFSSELPRVYNYFLHKTGDREQAQDLTAAAFERAWRQRSKYRPSTASLPAWLFGIARNVLKEYLRRYSADRRRLDSSGLPEELKDGLDVEASLQHRQEKERLTRLLCELSDREQLIEIASSMLE